MDTDARILVRVDVGKAALGRRCNDTGHLLSYRAMAKVRPDSGGEVDGEPGLIGGLVSVNECVLTQLGTVGVGIGMILAILRRFWAGDGEGEVVFCAICSAGTYRSRLKPYNSAFCATVRFPELRMNCPHELAIFDGFVRCAQFFVVVKRRTPDRVLDIDV